MNKNNSIKCSVCGKIVVPIKKQRVIRKGIIMSFVEDIMVCPNRRCGEIIR